MNLRHRFRFLLIIGLVLCLALLGREFLRSDDAEQAPASLEKVATVADPSVPTASPPLAPPTTAPAVTPAADVSSPSGTFRGRVIDAATREPVSEFELEFHPMHETKPGDQAPGARTFRTKDGRFEWQGIPPRLWMITAKARGYQRFELDQVLIPAGSAKEVVMPLRSGHTLRGRVYDEASGAGIASASLAFREANVGRYQGNFRMRVRTTTGADGSFVLDGVPAGSIFLSVQAPKYAAREIDVVVGKQTSPLEIPLSSGGAVAGYLATADGAPVAGSVAVAHLDEGHAFADRTGEAGEFEFDHLPAGRYQIVGRSGTQEAKREFSLAKDERIDGFVLVLGSGGTRTIRGTVTGVRPEDLNRLRVAAAREKARIPMGESPVDARGTFEIQGVEPGAVIVSAYLDLGRQVSKGVQVPPDVDVTVNLDFPRGARLSGIVTRGGQPLSNVWLGPQPLKAQKFSMGSVQTSKSGEYAIDGVPNGEYFITLGGSTAMPRHYRSRNFQVSGDTVFDIDVPVAQFSGRTIEEGGKVPVVGVDVNIWSAQAGANRVQWRERSNQLGEFTLGALEPGEYVLSAYKPGYEMYRERITYNSASDGPTIRLRQGKGVAIRVFEAGSARPIRSVVVTESIGGAPGTGFRVHLDENGLGHIPSALTGSTLTFLAAFYDPAVVADWNGQELDVQLRKQPGQ
jgi:hypothetical protein